MVPELLPDMLFNNHLIAAEHKAAVAIIKQLETDEINEKNAQLRLILNPEPVRRSTSISIRLVCLQNSNATFEQIAVSDLAEQMTLIDHHLFCALDSEYVPVDLGRRKRLDYVLSENYFCKAG